MKIIDQPREMGEQERADWAVLWRFIEPCLTGLINLLGVAYIILAVGGVIALAGYFWRLL